MRHSWFIILAVCLGCGPRNERVLSVTGQIEGVSIRAGSRVGGRVSEVLVKEGDSVKGGDVLVRLEPFESQAAVALAQARLAQAEATLAKLEAGAREEEIRQAESAAAQAEAQYQMALEGARSQEINAARASVKAAKAQRDQAAFDLERIRKLFDEQSAPEQVYERAKHAFESADAQHKAALEKLNMLVEGTRSQEIAMAKSARDRAAAALDEIKNGARREDIEVARAAPDAALADLERAKVGADEMVVKAPRDGVIESLDIHPGDLVKPGPLVRIVDPDDLELTVYVSAAALGRIRLNQRVTLTTDSHGPEEFQGTVAQIATQGEFTPRNLQTEEERVQQVFGVKIELDSAGGKLRAGMTATAHFELSD